MIFSFISTNPGKQLKWLKKHIVEIHFAQLLVKSNVVFHLSSLAGPTSQFLNEMHEFSELVLARMTLLVDQSHSVLLL